MSVVVVVGEVVVEVEGVAVVVVVIVVVAAVLVVVPGLLGLASDDITAVAPAPATPKKSTFCTASSFQKAPHPHRQVISARQTEMVATFLIRHDYKIYS